MTNTRAQPGALGRTRVPSVLSWNAGKLKARDDLILAYMESRDIPSIVAIQEPSLATPKIWKRSHKVIQAPDLLVYYEPQWTAHIMSTDHDSSIIKLVHQNLVVYCVYLRDGSKSVGISNLISSLRPEEQPNYLVMGDLNCVMEDERMNAAGTYLAEHLDSLCILNDWAYTFHRKNRRSSMLDYCIGSGSFLRGTCITLTDLDFSDHCGILYEPTQEAPSSSSTREDLTYKDYFPLRSCNLHRLKDAVFLQNFQDQLEELLSKSQVPITDWLVLRRHIISSLFNTGIRAPGERPHKRRYVSPEARSILEQRKALPFRSDEYNALSKALSRQLRRDRRESWDTFVSSITPTDSPFQLFRKSLGSPRVSGTIEEALSTLRSAFENPLPASKVTPSPPSLVDIRTGTFSFSMSDLDAALSACHAGSAPGPDGIPYRLFKAMGPRAKLSLLSIFNLWICSGQIHPAACQRLMIGLPKPDGGVRGLTLCNSILKIYERLLLPSIESLILPHLPDYQFGFRKGLSSAHQVLRLLSEVQVKRKSHLVLFYDVKKAFDRLDRSILLHELSLLPFDARILAALHQLLQPVQTRVVLNSDVSDEFTVAGGVPQGGILSPILFNFYLSRLGSGIDQTKWFAYADDLAVSLSGHLLSDLFEAGISTHQYITDYFSARRLEINLSKSGTMLISSRRPAQLMWPPEGVLPPRVDSYKYLGCLIDAKLTLKRWCDDLVKAIHVRVAFIRRLAATKHLSRSQVETLYVSIIRGKLNYAASIWSRSIHAQKVIQAELSCQRVCFGAITRTPLSRIGEESRLTPFSTLILRADLRLYLAIRHRPSLANLKDTMDTFLNPLFDVSDNELSEPMYDLAERTYLYDIGMTPYSVGLTDDSFGEKDILRVAPSKKRRPCRRSFRNELFLSRVRMRWLPTRLWVAWLNLDEPAFCRHCLIPQQYETTTHVLSGCPALDYSLLLPYGILSPKSISRYLYDNPEDFSYQNRLLEFYVVNALFKLPATDTQELHQAIDAPPSLKRSADLTPSPPPRPRRIRRTQPPSHSRGIKRRCPPDNHTISPPRHRGFSGPAVFSRALTQGFVPEP